MSHTYDDDAKRWHTCGRKQRYKTEKMVMQAVKHCKADYGETYDYYECPFCNGYHLTKMVDRAWMSLE